MRWTRDARPLQTGSEVRRAEVFDVGIYNADPCVWASLLHGEHFRLCAQPPVPHNHVLSWPLRVGLHAQIDAHVLSGAQRGWERRNEDRFRSVWDGVCFDMKATAPLFHAVSGSVQREAGTSMRLSVELAAGEGGGKKGY